MTLAAGRIFSFWMMIAASLTILGCVHCSKTGKLVVVLRRIAGLDAIEESVGRATEMGRPVHYSPGISDITTDTAPQTFAGLAILSYVTSLCAKYNAELIVTIQIPNVFPLAQEVVRQGYMSAGKSDAFKEDNVRFMAPESFAYAAGVLGILQREKVAANIMIGAWWAESLIIAEAGSQAGAIQVGGTANMHQLPFLVAACDYTLIGEEIYAGSAYLSQEKDKLGTIVAQDYIKLAVMAITIAGVIMVSFGNTFLKTLILK
ncbi:MAG: hypothetical protein FD169_1021 [Bacillota bacterium]|nr:MAG: hypothetical protein FD169_1021 [Bacillota bacterium]MBS3949462.1 hypothetical protein [Peptococcaceae bacterium]